MNADRRVASHLIPVQVTFFKSLIFVKVYIIFCSNNLKLRSFESHTAIPNKEVQGFTGQSLSRKQDPCNENRVPFNENRFFPVRIDLQGVPCEPNRVWVCSVPTLIEIGLTYLEI